MRASFVNRWLTVVAVAAVVVLSSTPSLAETASALLREDEPVDGFPGQTISAINNPAVNHVGGYATTLSSTGAKSLSHVWGHATGGPGAIILTEGVYAGYEQTSFESFNGFSNAGDPCYSALAEDLGTGTTGLDGVWVGTTPILVEEDPIGSLPGQFSTFNSRPGITADGIPYWVGGYSTIQGGSSQNRAMFFSPGLTPVIKCGDSIGGVAEPVDSGGCIDFDFRFSEFGTNWINQIIVDSSSTNDGVMVMNGNAVFLGGGVVREASPVPASIGGLVGENWDNFDFMGVAENGNFFFTGDTAASSSMDEFVVVGGQIALREGDNVDSVEGPVALSGSIEGGFHNEDGDWAVIWDVNAAAGNVEALIFNGEAILLEGEEVDWDGDGAVDAGAVLANFTGISTLVISDRIGTVVEIYFTADIDFNGTSSSSDDLEGLFRIEAEVEIPGIELEADIKPGSCPNPFNTGANGVTPVALLGTMDFDVTTVDISTLRIERADGAGGSVGANEGPQGPHTVLEDVGTPFDDDECGCHTLRGDGYMDLSMFFRSADVSSALGLSGLEGGTFVELAVRGSLLDGTPFFATDCVRIVPPNDGPGGDPINSSGSGGAFQRGGGNTTPPATTDGTEISDQDDPTTGSEPDRNLETRLLRLRTRVEHMEDDHAAELHAELRRLRDEAAEQGNLELEQRAARLLRRLQSARR